MPAYIIIEIDVHDPAAYDDYKKLTPATLEVYGGKFIVRGGAAETLEGDWAPKRIVVLEFPSVEKAKAWWHSEEYAGPKAMRHAASTSRMIVVEGFNG